MSSPLTNTTYLHNLIIMAMVDGHISEQEKSFLYRKCQEWKIDPADVDILLENPESLVLCLPVNLSTKKRYLNDFIEMACCDGTLHDKELNYLREICKKLEMDDSFIYEGVANFKSLKQRD